MKKRYVMAVLILVCTITRSIDLSSIAGIGSLESSTRNMKGNAVVHFVDVGQGDATLIQSGQVNTLIDTGTEKMYPQLEKYLKKQGVDEIENFIVTHPDADHMGGADLLLKNFEVKKFYSDGYSSKTYEYKEMMAALRDVGLVYNTVSSGQTLSFGSGTKALVLSPEKNMQYWDSNSASVVIRLDTKNKSYLFTGDIPATIENTIIKKYDVNVDVLKISHHGSSTASGILFLKTVSPDISVISVGKDNTYGHPNKWVLKKLQRYGGKVCRTDQEGTIVMG